MNWYPISSLTSLTGLSYKLSELDIKLVNTNNISLINNVIYSHRYFTHYLRKYVTS